VTIPSKLRIAEHVHWRRFDSELVVLDLERGQYYGLNEVAAEAFEHLARGETFSDTVAGLLQAYEVAPERLERDLERTFKDLFDRGVLVADAT
jgi:hypothetical protein